MSISNYLERAYWFCLFGKPSRKISSEEVLNVLDSLPPPVFFLSTGRTGTKWFAHLFSHDKSCISLHSPTPNLSIQSKYLYECYLANNAQFVDIGSQLFLTARTEFLRYAYKCEKRYIETNNNLTFFAYSLYKLLPQAKFVHLFRDPIKFVRSGIRREWYGNNRQASMRLPKITDSEAMSQIEKIAYLWKYVNEFILDFAEQTSATVYIFDFDQMNAERLKYLCKFLDLDQTLNFDKLINVKMNTNLASANRDLNQSEIEIIREITAMTLTRLNKIQDTRGKMELPNREKCDL